MIGWQIVRHAIVMVFSNLADALRISLLPYAAVTGLTFWMLPEAFGGFSPAQDSNPFADIAPRTYLLFLGFGVVYLWIAVAWHRFVLLEETPGAVLPAFHMREILIYFWKALLLGIIVLLISIPVGFVAVMIASVFAASTASIFFSLVIALVFGTVSVIPGIYVFYRLSLVLPAAAIGKPLTMGDSWDATGKVSGALWIVIAIIILVGALNLLTESFLGLDIASVSILIVYDWVMLLVSASLLTTLFGHLVEGRELG